MYVNGTSRRSLNTNYNRLGNITGKTSTLASDDQVSGYTYKTRESGSSTTAGPHAVTRDEFRYGPEGQRFYKRSEFKKGSTTQIEEVFYFADGTEHTFYTGDYAYQQTQKTYASGNVLLNRRHNYISWEDTVQYLHKDHLGSIVAITDSTLGGSAAAAAAHHLAFEPFGSRRKSDWTRQASAAETEAMLKDNGDNSTRGFTGHEHLDRTGFIHMNGRVYDPVLGRFLTPDPLVQAPTLSQSWNRYSYVWNNPLRYTDPSGYTTQGTAADTSSLYDLEVARGVRTPDVDVVDDGSTGTTTITRGGADIRTSLSEGSEQQGTGREPEEEVGPIYPDGLTESDKRKLRQNEIRAKMLDSTLWQGGRGAQKARDRSCGGRPCVDCGDGPGYAVGFSGSVTHPLYSIPASGINMMLDDPFLPTGLLGGIWQNANGDEFGGALEVGAEYTAGLGSRIVSSLDVIEIGAVPDMEFSLVIGVGVRLYYQNENFVGLGFAAGGGASWLTKPLSSKAVNAEIGGSLSNGDKFQ